MQPIIWRILVAVFVGSAVGAGQGLTEVEENRCGEQHEGTGCWQELANRPGCYLWNDAFNKSVSPSWTGECSRGMAQGAGELQWTEQPPPASGDHAYSASHRGAFRDGKKDGHWTAGGSDGMHGFEYEASYVAGKKHGRWIYNFGGWIKKEGAYVNDRRHGHWVEHNNQAGFVEEGPYVDDKRHGPWVKRYRDGKVEEGPYVDDKRHGHWIERDPEGPVEEGPYVEGERHGHWVKRYRDGNVEEGSYVEGYRDMDWTIRREPESNKYTDATLAPGADVVDPLLPEMVVIPAGSFRMGCVSGMDCDDNQEPLHEVSIASFELSKYEVTIEEYDRFTDATGRDRVLRYYPRESWGRHPVIYVTWYDAVAYAEWLAARTGEPYRLPSEAEWEYAARAGTETAYSWGNDIGSNRGHCDGCDSQWDDRTTAPVGSFEANPWMLHDMHGNAYEWVHDCAHYDYHGAPANGSVWADDEHCDPLQRVIRGGSYDHSPAQARSASRYSCGIGEQVKGVGFRIARTVVP